MSCAGILLSALAGKAAYDSDLTTRQEALERSVDAHVTQVQEKLFERELLSRVAASLFKAPDVIQVNMLAPIRSVIYAFQTDFLVAGWVARVDTAGLASAREQLGSVGRSGSDLSQHDCSKPGAACEAGKVNVVMDIEPRTALTTEYLGLIPREWFNKLLHQAAEIRRPIASDPVRVFGDKGPIAVVLISPVADKAGDIAGFVTFTYDLSRLIAAESDIRFSVSMRDRSRPDSEIRAGSHGEIVYSQISSRDDRADLKRALTFGGRDWELNYSIREDVSAAAWRAGLFGLSVGLLITTIVTLVMWHIGRSAIRLQTEVDTRRSYEARLTSMIDELNHRVKNILSVIQSIATRTLRPDVELDRARDLLIGRIHAMSHVVTLLSETDWQGVNLHDMFRPAAIANSDLIVVSGPAVLISPRAAQSFSLLFHELADHASEERSLAERVPNVHVEWDVVGEGADAEFFLRWTEISSDAAKHNTVNEFGLALLDRVTPESVSGTSRRFVADNSYVYELTAKLANVQDHDERGRVRAISQPPVG